MADAGDPLLDIIGYRDITAGGVVAPRRSLINIVGGSATDNPSLGATDLDVSGIGVSASILVATGPLVSGTLNRYDGSVVATYTMPASPVTGDVIGVAEVTGGTGAITFNGGGNNLADPTDATPGAPVAAMAISQARASLFWKFDGTTWLLQSSPVTPVGGGGGGGTLQDAYNLGNLISVTAGGGAFAVNAAGSDQSPLTIQFGGTTTIETTNLGAVNIESAAGATSIDAAAELNLGTANATSVASGKLGVAFAWTHSGGFVVTDSTANTVPNITIQTSGADGGIGTIGVGDIVPVHGAGAGSLYLHANAGGPGALYINTSTGGGTTWTSAGGGIATIASADTNILSVSGTTAITLTPENQLITDTPAFRTFYGVGAGNATTANRNTAFGTNALGSAAAGGQSNVAVGAQAGQSVSTSDFTTWIGDLSGNGASGSGNTGVGENCGPSVTGSNNTFLGRDARGPTSANSCTVIGYNEVSPSATVSSTLNICGLIWGTFDSSSSHRVRIGFASTVPAGDASLELSDTGKALLLNRNTTGETTTITEQDGMIHYESTLQQLQGRINGVWVDLGAGGGGAVTSVSPGADVANILSVTPTTGAVVINTLNQTIDTVNRITFYGGNNSGNGASGVDNTIFGDASGTLITSGSSNTLYGSGVADSLTSGTGNVVVGKGSGGGFTTQSNNTIVGVAAGPLGATHQTTCIGAAAGASLTTASNSIMIGYLADSFESAPSVQSQLNIGNFLFGDMGHTTKRLRVGGSGVTLPSATLDLAETDGALALNRVANDAAVATPVNGMVAYMTDTEKVRAYQDGSWGNLNALPLGFIDGLHIANSSGTPDEIIDVDAGSCRDSTDVFDIASSGTLNLDITFLGADGIDTGSVAADSSYNVFVIADTTGVESVAGLFSLLADPTANLPSGYDVFRRVGWIRTATSDIITFFQARENGRERWTYWKRESILQTAGSASSWTDTATDASDFVPPTATNQQIGIIANAPSGSVLAHVEVIPDGWDETAGANSWVARCGLSVAGQDIETANTVEVPVGPSQLVRYQVTGAGSTADIFIRGFEDSI